MESSSVPAGEDISTENSLSLADAVKRAKNIKFGEEGEKVGLDTNRGTIFRIGRIKVPRIPLLFDYEIPVFCFVVVEREPSNLSNWEGGNYIATCINLQIDGYGKTPADAQRQMARFVGEYVFKIFKSDRHPEKENAWDCIFSRWRSNTGSSKLWDKYNVMQIHMAKQGDATESVVYDTYKQKIENLDRKAAEITINSLNNDINELRAELEKQKLKNSEMEAKIKNLTATAEKVREKKESTEKKNAEIERLKITVGVMNEMATKNEVEQYVFEQVVKALNTKIQMFSTTTFADSHSLTLNNYVTDKVPEIFHIVADNGDMIIAESAECKKAA